MFLCSSSSKSCLFIFCNSDELEIWLTRGTNPIAMCKCTVAFTEVMEPFSGICGQSYKASTIVIYTS